MQLTQHRICVKRYETPAQILGRPGPEGDYHVALIPSCLDPLVLFLPLKAVFQAYPFGYPPSQVVYVGSRIGAGQGISAVCSVVTFQ